MHNIIFCTLGTYKIDINLNTSVSTQITTNLNINYCVDSCIFRLTGLVMDF